MNTGKVIKILLDSGSATGLRHAELVNWTGQAIACPRAQIKALANWDEASRPGVYFLYGDGPDTAQLSVYIGESENVRERLKDHLIKKDFWNEVVLFTNKDNNLTKAHVKYLESRLVQMTKAADRHPLINDDRPQAAMLPRGEIVAMEEFINHARTLLGVLGYKTLEPLAAPLLGAQIGVPAMAQVPITNTETTNTEQLVFLLSGKGIEAKAVQSNEGFVVLAGSGLSAEQVPSLSAGYKRLRDNLIKENVIGMAQNLPNKQQEFLKNHVFSSPSQAASVILGTPTNGRQAWKTAEGKTIAEVEEAVS